MIEGHAEIDGFDAGGAALPRAEIRRCARPAPGAPQGIEKAGDEKQKAQPADEEQETDTDHRHGDRHILEEPGQIRGICLCRPAQPIDQCDERNETDGEIGGHDAISWRIVGSAARHGRRHSG